MAKVKGSRGSLRKKRAIVIRTPKGLEDAPKAGLILPDLGIIMEHFSQAQCMVIVCQRSLAAQELLAAGCEEETLREAVRLLQNVYNEIDAADRQLKCP